MITRLRLHRFAVHRQYEQVFGKIHRFERGEFDPRAKAFGLLLHAHHQLIAVNALGETRKIFDDARGSKQAARLQAGKHERIQIRPRGVKRRGQTRATRADDDHFFHIRTRNISLSAGKLASVDASSVDAA